MTPSAHVDTFARDSLPPLESWPELLFELPELAYPARINCATELLDRAMDRGWGERIAIQAPGIRWTYRELLAQANRIAGVLTAELGVVPGNRVLLRGPNNPLMAACWFGVQKAGAVAVATMPLLRARELTAIIDKARVSHALCDARLAEELDIARAACSTLHTVALFGSPAPDALDAAMARHPASFGDVDTAADDVCMIAFTSGTTGVPKGTMHFHRDAIAICDCFPRSVLATRPDDVFCGTPPLAFTFGLGGLLLFPLRFGASTVLQERLTPETLLQTIQDFRATVCFTAPTFYRQMAPLVRRFALASLERTVSAGEALPDATRQLWKQATGIEMIDGIGSTELLHIFISAAGADVRPGATGRPIPGYRACVLDGDGRPLPPGQPGRLAVKGPTGCRYLADDRQRIYVQDGWNVTGDSYVTDADGYYFYQARTDDLIVTAGYNVAGPEVEAALMLHPAVAEAGVVGAPDEARGQIVTAFVVLKAGRDGDASMAVELQEFVKRTIAPYKYPRAVVFRESLPRTETGKLQRFRLRAEAASPAQPEGRTR
jgi:2-aminobenzoate-CoA ligase